VIQTNVFQLSQPRSFADPLTEVLRNGARALLAQAVEAEVATLLSRYADEATDDGRQRLVRHGTGSRLTSAIVKGFGCRPCRTMPQALAAGVRKPPSKGPSKELVALKTLVEFPELFEQLDVSLRAASSTRAASGTSRSN
jgi:hypothetical protein